MTAAQFVEKFNNSGLLPQKRPDSFLLCVAGMDEERAAAVISTIQRCGYNRVEIVAEGRDNFVRIHES